MKTKKKQQKGHIKRTRGQEIWHQFKKNKGAMIGLVLVGILVLTAIFGDLLWDFKDVVTKTNVRE